MSDEYLRTRLELLAAGPSTADWSEARYRAMRAVTRRRRLAVALAAAATVMVAAPALALTTGVTDFSKAEPAPEPLVLLFDELNSGAPRDMTPSPPPGVEARDTRAILRRELFGRPHTLWVAPTKDGGFCMFLLAPRGGGGGGCEKRGTPLSPGVIRPGDSGTPEATFGSAAVPGATRVDVVHKDGSTTQTDLTRVSAPIDAAFFVLEVPAERGIYGWVVRDSEGRELARRMRPGER